MKSQTKRIIAFVMIIMFSLLSAQFDGLDLFGGQIVAKAATSYPGMIGVGLEGVGGRGLEFVDVAKTMRPFEAIGGGSVAKDSKGWPLADAQTVLFDMRPVAAWAGTIDDPDNYQINMTGTYKMSFTGQATIGVADGNFSIANQVYNSGTNTTTADLIVNGPLVFIKFTNTSGGIKNLKVTRPGYAHNTTQKFHTPFLNAIASANFSVLRFMDWTQTNNSNPSFPETTDWVERKAIDDATFQSDMGRAGAPWEWVIELGNTTGKDIWINVPVAATDDYINKLATLVKNNLNSNLKVYVEYSNEVWNWSFWQASWNNQKGASLGLNYIKAYAKRTAEISNIFKTVFGAAAINNRIRVVNCWQVGWNPPDAQYEEQMQYINDNFGAPNTLIYAIGMAPYFSETPADGETVTQILDQMQSSSNNSVLDRQKVIAVSNKWSLPGKTVCYEGGPDNGGGSTTNIANRISANRTTRMRDIISNDISTNFLDLGGTLFMYFTLSSGYSRYGCWGLTDDITNPDRNYKFSALRTLAGTSGSTPTPTPTPTPVPGTGTGLKGEYYDNSDFTSLKVTRTDATVNFDWGSGSPDVTVGADTYSVRWTGQVQPKYSQTYTFYTNTDDGVRLWVNNQLLIDKWVNQAPTEWSGTIALTAGQKYDIKMEYYENTSGAVAKLLWSSSSQAKEIIPQSQLYPAATPTPTPSGSLLAVESFTSSTGALHNTNAGSGWSGAWDVQNADTSVPGYNIANSSQLAYSNLARTGNYAIGGDSYQSAGRGLDVSAAGAFGSYLTGGLIGASGKTLWLSAMIRKDVNNDEENYITLHKENIAWYANPPLVSMGYFGANSNSGGTKYWTLKIENTYYRTSVPVTIGQTALLVMKINFGTTNTVSLYVNPSSLGGSAPASANASGTTTNSIAFKSLSYDGGNGFNASGVDEIRFGTAYSAVTPIQ